MVAPGRRSLLTKYATSAGRAVLKIGAVEATLDPKVERAYVVLTLQSNRALLHCSFYSMLSLLGTRLPAVLAFGSKVTEIVLSCAGGSVLCSTLLARRSAGNCRQRPQEAMEFLATFGMAAKNMFDYNRENFQFDQEQRQSRELLRQTLQLKRFTLFREDSKGGVSVYHSKELKCWHPIRQDIRDLVELTVGKMEMYHLVAALFMESSMALYFEGRIRHIAPPFVIGLLFISIASAYMYLLLAVWLSMHASICSHSLGVRLLTRFVRLPVPGMQQMGGLNARLADYERQGVKNMLRVPVVGATQQWGKPGQPLDSIQEGQPSAGTDFLGEGRKHGDTN
eukprot:s211_g10.t1